MTLSVTLNLEKLNSQLEQKKPKEIIAWTSETFMPKLAMTSSFGPESGVLLHMVSQVNPHIPVLFLETGYHFPETIQYKELLIRTLGLTQVIDLKADPKRRAEVVESYQGTPYEKNPDLCCQINKVEPLDKALRSYDAWMSGIRRRQSDTRKSIRIVEEYEGQLYKISPIANFTSRDVWWYLKEHQIPQHPLFEKGYLSIGCWPCTRPVQDGDDERSGRWAGKAKKECGIHQFKEIKVDKEKDEGETSKHISENI